MFVNEWMDGWMDRRIKHLWKTHSVKLHIGHCQVCCQRMNYEGSCHMQEIGIHGGQGKNWAKEWTKYRAKAVASLCCWEVVQAATANSYEKSPQAGDGQGSLTMAASLLISPSTHPHTHTHTHTQEYPGISFCLQSVALPKSNPHSHICIFNPTPYNQAFQIPVKKPIETNSKRGLLLLQCSPPAPLGSRLQLQALRLSDVLLLL